MQETDFNFQPQFDVLWQDHYRELALYSGRGVGKEQPISEPILTLHGWKTMGDIEVGDYVYTINGLPTKVIQIHPQGVKDVYNVAFTDGTSTRCGIDHLWAVWNRNDYERGLKTRVMTTGELLAAGVTSSHSDGKSIRSKFSIPLSPCVQYPSRPVTVDPYLLGLMLGDGCFTANQFSFSNAENDLLSYIEQCLPKFYKRNMGNHYQLSWGTTFVKEFKELGLFGKYSHDKFIPKDYIYNSESVRVAVLSGLLNTDGNVSKNFMRYDSTSKQLFDDVTEITRSLGFIVKERSTDIRKNPCYGCTIIGDFTKLKLSIKHKSKLKPRLTQFKKSFASIEYIGKEESKCITVDHPSHLYITKDFILTHNSFAVADYLVLAALAKKHRILCTREIQNSINDSVIALLKDSIERHGVNKYFDIQKSAIYCQNGSEFIFKGIKHSIESIKSMANITICWLEEAQTTSDDSLNILLPTIFRNKGAKIIYTYNPRFASDAVFKRFNGDIIPNHSIVKKLDWRDNKYFDQAMREEMEYAFKVDATFAAHVWEGELMPSGNATAVLPLNWLRKCVDVHKKLNYKPDAFKYMGLDFADGGSDKSALAIRHGAIITHVHEFEQPFINKSVDYADGFAQQYSVIRVHFDAIGIGAGAKGDFNRLQRDYTAEPHIGSASPNGKDAKFTDSMTNGQFFRNLKAQSWWHLRLRVENTLRLLDGEQINPDQCLFIDGNIPFLDKMLLELAQASYKHEDGKLMVDKAPDDGMKSPNCFVAGTKILTPNGEVNIEELQIGDEVITPLGVSRIIYTHVNKAEVIENMGLIGTADHKVFTWNEGFKPLQMLSSCDIIEKSSSRFKWLIWNILFTKVKSFTNTTTIKTLITTQHPHMRRKLELKDYYIGGYGLMFMGIFQKVVTFTTSTVIVQIMKLKTLSALKQKNTKDSTCLKGLNAISIEEKIKNSLIKLGINLKNGMRRMKVKHGMLNTLLSRTITKKIKSKNAKFVEINLQQNPQLENIVVKNAESLETIQLKKHSHVKTATHNLNHHTSEKNIQGVVKNAPMQLREVYNLTLEHHNVYYANGVLVKNCADAVVMSFVHSFKKGLKAR